MICTRSPRCAYSEDDRKTLHDRTVANLEQAWEITGGSEDELTGTMMQISQTVAREFGTNK
jgi:hypothetical protein